MSGQADHGLRTPLEGTSATEWDDRAPIPAPLRLIAPEVPQDWVDYNGHMSESCYLLVFGDQSDAFFRYVGIDEAYRAGGHSLFTVQTMIFNLAEAHLGDRLDLSLQLLDADEKRLHIFHAMHNAATGELLATGEQMLVHVDLAAGKSCPMPADLQRKVAAIRAAHSALPQPAQAGRNIAIRRG
ncbi:thioesterase family protein [Novosphingobium sp.]|uniref:thioesterase family protein n=1 Tax=Novosphingobium sp. TaxID=1874826 RepID=UPI0025F19F00|nr:thioesterase family protein [Novosphingobium sp.]MCC6924428.1 thioesterase family protein [Novosphingobium sp.]